MRHNRSKQESDIVAQYSAVNTLLEEWLIESCGETVFERFSKWSHLAKQYRKTQQSKHIETLQAHISELVPKKRAEMIRVFNLYFQVNNLVEDAIRIQLNKARAVLKDDPRDNTLKTLVLAAKQKRLSLKRLLALLDDVHIGLVWTAHPTETQPLSKLRHLQALGQLLQRMPNSCDDLDSLKHRQEFKANLSLLWQSDAIKSEKMTVLAEQRRHLFFVEQSLAEVLPKLFEDLALHISKLYDVKREKVSFTPCIKFHAWPGGDRDGNPNVTALTSFQALCLQKRSILRIYLKGVKALLKSLSISSQHVAVSEALQQSIKQDKKQFPDFAHQTESLNIREPYRKKLDFMRMKLEKNLNYLGTLAEDSGLKRTLVGKKNEWSISENKNCFSLQEFYHDLRIIQDSLIKHNAKDIAFLELQKLITQVALFEKMSLDIRQHAAVHQLALKESFKVLGMSMKTNLELKAAIVQECRSQRLLGLAGFFNQLSSESQEVFKTLAMIVSAKQQFSDAIIQSYIISMTSDSSDILALLLLLKELGLVSVKKANVIKATLDIVPLFETKQALKDAPAILTELFEDSFYRSYLLARGNVQEVMLGYSDSNKDIGPLASHLLIYQLQENVLKIATKFGVTIRFFHGRGGTISRGGGPMHRAIQSLPLDTSSHVKMTEQGEMVSANYLNQDLAYRHLEQILHASVTKILQEKTKPKIKQALLRVPKRYINEWVHSSQQCYEQLVKANPSFSDFFHHVSPIDILQVSTMGSRPSKRPKQQDTLDITQSYRAIPWVFAWMQTRILISGFYGVGTAFHQFEQRYGIEPLQDLYLQWPFFRAFIQNIQMVLLKADMGIAKHYLQLHPNPKEARTVFETIEGEYVETVEQVLQISQQDELMADLPKIKAQILRRNPFVDPLNIMQIVLMQTWRKQKKVSSMTLNSLEYQLLETINGIAAGVRNYA